MKKISTVGLAAIILAATVAVGLAADFALRSGISFLTGGQPSAVSPTVQERLVNPAATNEAPAVGAEPVAGAPASGPLSDAEWKKILTPEEYDIIRQDGTEDPFSSPLDRETRPGTYYSVDCGVALFRSEQKYDSGTGWPSFWAPISADVVTLREDNSIPLESRTEVRDAKCDGHLGHVFDDGPPPTGKRYCMNGVALKFVPDPPKTATPTK